MLGTQKSLKNIKKYLEGKAGSSMLSMKVLRYVLAVGFVLAPWLGGEAYADTPVGNIVLKDVTGNQIASGTANIYVNENKISNGVGLNEFTHFVVGEGQYANIHFATDANGSNPLHTVVNTVQNQIGIYGTVNAIRNGKIGGNLYFISPAGMIVGSTGVINAGSLTMVAKSVTISTADEAATKVSQGWGPPDSGTSIYIHGRINTETGIDLQTETVNITKADGQNIPDPYLHTGVVFNDIVNADFTNVQTYSITERRLDLTKDANGNISIINPVNKTNIGSKEVTSSGDGTINIRAQTSSGQEYSGTFVLTDGSIDAIGELQMDVGKDITISSASIIKANKITMSNNNDNIENDGTIEGLSDVTIHVLGADNNFFVTGQGDQKYGTNCLVNRGTIKSTGGGISLLGRNGISNYGIIEANGQIDMTALNGVVNQGMIKSNNSNVSFVVGREFFNVAKGDTYINNATYVPHNLTYLNNNVEVLIEAGGNVQISYTNPSTGTIGKNPNDTDDVTYAPIGIYNSSTMRSGTNISATGGEGNVSGSGSGNIWLTSSYNIENTATGQMIAGRQITLNARDFLHNYGLIQGVTYLDIKSIMGYVYNHASGVIRAPGGNIGLSTGQANLDIQGDDGTKKELYRKFTPIIIKGSVEATSDNNNANQTKEGNIIITAHLGDIYVNGGTIETKAKRDENNVVVAAAGDVILNAAQNITIGFDTVEAWGDDPTTNEVNVSERKYYKPKVEDGNLVSGNASTISGPNVTLSAGSINNKHALIGGNLTLDSVILEGSLTLQGNNMTVSGVQRSDNSSGALQVVANGVGGPDSAINSLNLNINDNLFFDKLNVNTADINVSGDLQINKLHVADLAHFTSNNTVVGVYGGSTTPSNDQSDALFRDLGNGSTTWMGLTISNGSYSVTNSTQISNSVENLAQMSAKLVDYTPQDSYNEHYGDISGCFERYDIIEAPNRPTGGIAPTAESGGAELKQDENGLHIEMKNNNFEHEMDQRREQDKREGEKEA